MSRCIPGNVEYSDLAWILKRCAQITFISFIIKYNCFYLFIILTGTMFAPTFMFWAFNGLLLLVDTTGKPSFITRYRIQEDKNNPVCFLALLKMFLLYFTFSHSSSSPSLINTSWISVG